MLTFFCVGELLGQLCEGKKYDQNRVSNGGFETATPSCTTAIGPIGGAGEGALAWDGAPGDIDSKAFYMSACSPEGTYDPLDNIHGTQAPLSGDAYLSVISGPPVFGVPGELYYGYTAQELVAPLLKGVTYYVEFHVSLADISTRGVNSLGLYLTDNAGDFTPNSNGDLTHLTPQIPNAFPAESAYVDYAGWTKVCGYYTPSVNGVKYILIGNFRSGTTSPSFSPGYQDNTDHRPIYYIDQVFISEYSCCQEEQYYQNQTALPSSTSVNNRIVAGNDVAPGTPGTVIVSSGQVVEFSAGNEILLKPGFSALAGSNFSARIQPCTRGEDDNQLSVVINFEEISYSQYTLTAVASNGSGNYSYQWSNGATTQSISSGYGFNVYTVVVTDNEPDQAYAAPCNIRVGIAEFIDNCPTCRSNSSTDQAKPSADASPAYSPNEQMEEVSEVSVFPNPSRGKFNLRMSSNIVRYVVVDLKGQLVAEGLNH